MCIYEWIYRGYIIFENGKCGIPFAFAWFPVPSWPLFYFVVQRSPGLGLFAANQTPKPDCSCCNVPYSYSSAHELSSFSSKSKELRIHISPIRCLLAQPTNAPKRPMHSFGPLLSTLYSRRFAHGKSTSHACTLMDGRLKKIGADLPTLTAALGSEERLLLIIVGGARGNGVVRRENADVDTVDTEN